MNSRNADGDEATANNCFSVSLQCFWNDVDSGVLSCLSNPEVSCVRCIQANAMTVTYPYIPSGFTTTKDSAEIRWTSYLMHLFILPRTHTNQQRERGQFLLSSGKFSQSTSTTTGRTTATFNRPTISSISPKRYPSHLIFEMTRRT